MVPLTADFWSITLGAFLVGLGWSAVNVSATTMIADASGPAIRGRAVGLSDTFAAVATLSLPLIAGPLVDLLDLASTAVLATVLTVPPLVLFSRLLEPTPGTYETKEKGRR